MEKFQIEIFKRSTIDNYNDGQNPNKSQNHGLVLRVKRESYIDIISELNTFFGDNLKHLEVYENRIMLSILENGDGEKPTEIEMKDFKENNKDLYCADYDIYISKTIELEFNHFENEKIIELCNKGKK